MQYWYIKKEISRYEQRLRSLERAKAKAETPAENYINTVERISLTVLIVNDICLRNQVQRFVLGISDTITRQVFNFRCLNACTWEEVSGKIGYYMTSENARQIYSRCLKQAGIE